jgi:hypothetical protein
MNTAKQMAASKQDQLAGELPATEHDAPAVSYDPNKLLDRVAEKLEVKDDFALARTLELSHALLGKMRHGKQRIGATILLRMQEFSGISIGRLKQILGDRRARFRVGGG